MQMNCSKCAAPMTSRRGEYPYSESGLDNVVLTDAEIRECSCGEASAVIPRLTALHEMLALHLLQERRPLVGAEIVFLRKVIDWSPEVLARSLGLPSEWLTAWERDVASHTPVFLVADRLLRTLVANALAVPFDVLGMLPSIVEGGSRRKVSASFISGSWAVV